METTTTKNVNPECRELPKDLAGLQHIQNGPIQAGDVWVWRGKPKEFVDSSWFGVDVKEEELCPEYGVYRKMPVSNQGYNDPPLQVPREDREAFSRIYDEFTKRVMVDDDGVPAPLGRGGTGIHETPSKARAKTNDDGKPPLSRLPWKALREVALVQQYGFDKYGSWNNWRMGIEASRSLSCALRHIADHMDGIDADLESGRSHLAHAACRVLFTLENIIDRVSIDDRYTP